MFHDVGMAIRIYSNSIAVINFTICLFLFSCFLNFFFIFFDASSFSLTMSSHVILLNLFSMIFTVLFVNDSSMSVYDVLATVVF